VESGREGGGGVREVAAGMERQMIKNGVERRMMKLI